MQRRFASAAAAAGIALLGLTGCFKSDMDLKIHADNTVDGSMIVAFDKSLTEEIGGHGHDPLESGEGFDTDELTAHGGEAEVEPYDDGDWIGEKVTFSNVPLEAFSEALTDTTAGTGDAFELRRDGDTFIFDATFDASPETMGGDSATPEGSSDGSDEFSAGMGVLTAKMMEDAELRFALTFPGEIVATNGKVDGTTVSWAPKMGEKTHMHAEAQATEVVSGTGGESSASTSDSGRVGVDETVVLAVLTVLLIGGGVWAYGRRRTDDVDAPDDAAPPAPELVEATEPETTIAPGWYPTADGATLRYHDGTDWTDHVQPNTKPEGV